MFLNIITFSKKRGLLFIIFGSLLLLATIWLTSPSAASNPPGYFWLDLEPWVEGLSQPSNIVHAGDGRLFITERAGVIRIIDENGQLRPTPFLNITDRVGSTDNWEQGLLGLAFHPDYANNGFFFVNYTQIDGDTQIARFQVSDGDPNIADPDSEVTVMNISQPTVIHNGGGLKFGPDGYLYLGLGDGGWLSDPQNQAQNRQLLLGKILRIDVTTNDNPPYYTVPNDNPFVGDPDTQDEIWAIGLRNPWRITFDSLTDDMYIGDVGNFGWEEISFEEAGSLGGRNYGWRCYEGETPFVLDGCGPESNYIFPIHTYRQEPGCAVTGGYVYRGSQYPFLQGYYIFTDLCHGQLWTLHQGQGIWQANQRGSGSTGTNISTFGQDVDGELYAADYFSGTIYRLVAIEVGGLSFISSMPAKGEVSTPTPVPVGPDLVVNDLTIVPSVPIAGQQATVYVSVINQGNQGVPLGNNFFIDFYVDRVPVPYSPGDIYWGVQGSQFSPGEVRSFSAPFTFTSGSHELYIQVDSDLTVDETDEDNNIFGPQDLTVTSTKE